MAVFAGFVLICLLQALMSIEKTFGSIVEVSLKTEGYDDYYKPIWQPEDTSSQKVRSRRDIINGIKINFINKSGREVRVYQVGYFGFFVTPKFDLRPNEPRALEVSSGTVWEVRDLDTGYYMLTNGKQRFEVRGKSSNKFLDLRIKRPHYLERKLRKFSPVPEKYLRIMIIADETVTNYHGKKQSNKLILTIMSAVSKIFQDKSLGIRINIILTKIFLITDGSRSFRIYENDPDSSITNACSFASKLARENGVDNYDFVAVMTRKSIGPSGYAAMYTMCTTRSCSLVKENGFNTAYVIAHEAGHALGIDHDGEDGDCKDDQLRGSIMSPNVYSKHEKYHWSFCSKRSLYENIKYFACLDKKLQDDENNAVNKFYELPGEISTKTDQCKSSFGFRATGCYVYYGACEFLWCRKTQWSGCAALALTSPLEGTNCGREKWCIKGECVERNKKQSPIHGNWGEWTSFGKCKGFCGAGIRKRSRTCNNPAPKHGGRKCQGISIDVEACKLEECSVKLSKADERDNKCRKLGILWREYSEEMQNSNLTNARIACNFEAGQCGWKNDVKNAQKWELNSGPTKSLKTGPANDNTMGTREGRYVYFEASWVNPYYKPTEGSKSKLISKPVLLPTVCFSFHYHMYGENMGRLKLYKMNEKKELEAIWSKVGSQGNEWFEDEVTIRSETRYQLVFEAIRGNGYRSDIAIDDIKIAAGPCKNDDEPQVSSCSIKCISPGDQSIKEVLLDDGFPCQKDISDLDICYQGKCLNVGCDYKIGSVKEFDSCGVCEGDGSSCKAVTAKKIVQASKTFVEAYVIPEGSENIVIKMKKHKWLLPGIYIDDSKTTNVFNTDGNTWPFGNYTFNDNLFIYKENPLNLVITIPKLQNEGCRVMVFNPLAKEDVNTKPKTEVVLEARLPITKEYDRFEINVKSWTPCSKSCDGGVQKPVLSCIEKKSERNITDLYCSDIIGIGTELKRACNIQRCRQRYSWIVGAWSACSATCGMSFQARRVKCLDNRVNRIVENAKCLHKMPPQRQSCFAGPCMDHSFFIKPWGQCSTTCGQGYQIRKIGCSKTNYTSIEKPLITCPGKLPVNVRSCHFGPCSNYRWMSRSITQCSESCGGGLRINTYSCYHVESRSIVFDSLCSKPRPPSIESCNRFDCN